MKRIQQFFKWATLLFFGNAVYALTIGQIVPLEFADWHQMHLFYDIILQGLPIAILLTLVWTLEKGRPKRANIVIGVLTPVIAGGMLFATFFLMFSYGFGAWVDEEIMYEKNDHPEVTINQQLWDIGAFGYGGKRTVKLTPFLGAWQWVENIDITNIDTTSWSHVQKDDDEKFP